MKKGFLLSIVSIFLFSCAEDNFDVPETTNTELSNKSFEGDVIVPLDSLMFKAKLPSVANKTNNVQTMDVWTMLYQLNGIDFYIQSYDSYLGKNTLQSNGKGQPITLQTFSNSNQAQLFRLSFLPASSGIPYLIYSSKENVPIGAGSYSSSPNTYVLYTQNANSTGLFGFSWDFYLNTEGNGFYIENQDLIGQGSGGMWDVYRYVLRMYNGNIDFTKQTNSTNQQFKIIPNDIFNVSNVQATLNGAQIVSSVPTTVKSNEVINNTSTTMPFTVTFNETLTTTSNFKQTTGITTNHTAQISGGFSLFKIIEANAGYTFSTSKTKTTEYGSSVTQSNSFTETFNITVPPSRRVVYKYIAMEHLVNLPYTATMTGQNTSKIINVEGIYTGVEYSSTRLEVTEYPAGTGAKGTTPSPIRTYTIYPNGTIEQ